jgi:hypothetical protein
LRHSTNIRKTSNSTTNKTKYIKKEEKGEKTPPGLPRTAIYPIFC